MDDFITVIATVLILAFAVFFYIIAPILIIRAIINRVKTRKKSQNTFKNFHAHQTPCTSVPANLNVQKHSPVSPIHTPLYASVPSPEEEKGTYGEYLLVKSLKELPGEKRILTNCYIPKEDGTTTELDIIMIHETGVYVIEAKNYSGWIFGTDTDKNWTHTYPNGQKYQFYNPIKQNENHIKHLKKLIGDNFYYFSFVVFIGNCQLKNIINNTKTAVCDEYLFKGRLNATLTAMNKTLDTETIKDIHSKLSEYEYATKEEKEKHIQTIKGDLNG